MNKRDLFAEKIVKSPLTIAFPDYTGNVVASLIETLTVRMGGYLSDQTQANAST